MRNIRSIAAVFFAVGAISAQPSQTIVYDNGFPYQNFQFQNFPGFGFQGLFDAIQPTRLAITEPFQNPWQQDIHITSDVNVCVAVAYCSLQNVIFAPPQPIMSGQSIPIMGVDEFAFTHELMHQGILAGNALFDIGTLEGLSSGKRDLLWIMLARQNSAWFASTQGHPPIMNSGPLVDLVNNEKITAFGGANNSGIPYFYGNLQNNYYNPSSLYAILMERAGGDYRKIDHALNLALPQSPNGNTSDILAAMDSLGITVDGVLPSTFLRRDVTKFGGAIVGTRLGITSGAAVTANYQQNFGGGWPFNPMAYDIALAKFTNQSSSIFPAMELGQTVLWTIYNSYGNVVHSGKLVIDSQKYQYFNLQDSDTHEYYYLTDPPGSYKIVACVTDETGNCSTNDPDLNDIDFFPFIGSEQLSPGDIAVMTNGPEGKLFSDLQLSVISPDPSNLNIERYPGLVIFRNLPQNVDGSFADLTVTDGTYVRTFTPNRFAATPRYFKRRDEPIVTGILDSNSNQTSMLVAGNAYSILGWNLTANDPTTVLPPSTEGCGGTKTNDQGRTEVVFTDRVGNSYLAPITSCSFGQLTILAPAKLPPHGTVSLKVVVNQAPSLELFNLQTEASPQYSGHRGPRPH